MEHLFTSYDTDLLAYIVVKHEYRCFCKAASAPVFSCVFSGMVEQWLAQIPHLEKVLGSVPTPAFLDTYRHTCVDKISQLTEHTRVKRSGAACNK